MAAVNEAYEVLSDPGRHPLSVKRKACIVLTPSPTRIQNSASGTTTATIPTIRRRTRAGTPSRAGPSRAASRNSSSRDSRVAAVASSSTTVRLGSISRALALSSLFCLSLALVLFLALLRATLLAYAGCWLCFSACVASARPIRFLVDVFVYQSFYSTTLPLFSTSALLAVLHSNRHRMPHAQLPTRISLYTPIILIPSLSMLLCCMLGYVCMPQGPFG